MQPYIPIREYRPTRPSRLQRWDPLFKILSKVNRDWVFGWRMRNRIYRWVGVSLAPDSSGIFIGRETWIDDNFPELIHIGEGVVIGWRCVLIAHNTQMMPPSVAPIHLGKKVFLGQGVTVMPGVTIGEYAQIGTNALVTKDVEPYTVAAGVPAKPIRKLTDEEIALRNSPQYLG